MQNKNKLRVLSLFCGAVLVSSIAIAGTGTEAQTLLINKLTNVFLRLPEGNATKKKMTLRLADLHAERGRLEAKAELEKGCIKCGNGEKDRKKALEYYQYALPSLKGEARRNVLVQVGHLYEVLGKNQKAIGFYKKVIQGHSGNRAGEAHFSLAEIYFKQRQFSAAMESYKKALASESFKRRGLASFRLAWCQYNTGQIKVAVVGLEKMLRTPELLSRNSGHIVNVDEDFKTEVAKDYTVFMAHSSMNSQSVKKVYRLSPGATRIENVSFLARELERLGRVKLATSAWELVIRETSSPQIRMEGLIYLAGLQLKSSQKQKVLPYLKRAFSQWTDMSKCKDQKQCDELKQRVRRLVFDWNRTERKKPSPELLEAYQAYFKVAPQDGEALELAGQAAMQAKNYELAYQWNGQAYQLTSDPKKKETLLLRRIEVAELAKNPQWLKESQAAYLTSSPNKSKGSEIRYQMAQTQYDEKKYQKAAEDFKALANNPSVSKKLRLQSAEMALDALVLTKNDSLIESWASQFAQSFPSQRKRFMGLAGQSVLSQTAKLSTTGSADSAKAWATLNRFDISTADPEKKKTYLKNRVILARKLKKYKEMDQSLHSFLALKNLTSKERKFALENKVWLSELQLNFNQSYLAYKKLNTKNWLELARLADLAEKPAQNYYYNYLRQKPDQDLAFSICLKLVKEAGHLGGRQKACVPYLSQNKDTFAQLILELYGQKKNNAQLTKMFRRYGLDKTAAASVLTRSQLMAQGQTKIKKLSSHKLDGRPSRVGRSLKARLKRITDFEKVIAKATKTQDWLTQTLFLSQLKAEYIRFYNELLSLPSPKGLSETEQQEYLSLLSQQAAPYKQKADEIQFKLDELWKNTAAIDQIFQDFHRASKEVQALLGPQVEKVQTVARQNKRTLFDLVYRREQKKRLPSLARLELARGQVKNAPLNKEVLRNLIQLETARGYKPMIIYLNSRLQMVDRGFESKERSL